MTLPNTATTHARIKVEAIGNVFFDVNNSDITIVQDMMPPVTTATLSPPTQNGWYASPTLTLSARRRLGLRRREHRLLDRRRSLAHLHAARSRASRPGTTSSSSTATDNAGNVEATKLIAFKADTTSRR